MTTFLPVLRRDFPEFDPVKVFEAVVPVYFVRLAIEVLEPQQLSTFATYFLHAVGLGVNNWSAIARLLGVDERDLASAGFELLKYGFIDQGSPTNSERPLTLTDAGKKALADQGAPPIPKRKSCRLHLNGLTGNLSQVDETAWSNERMCKEALFVLPRTIETPTVGDFAKEDVADVLRHEPAFIDNDVIEVIDLKTAYLEYVPGVTIFLMRHRENAEQRIAAFKHSMYLPGESDALQRLLEDGVNVLPSDAEILQPTPIDIPSTLPQPVARLAQTLIENTVELTNLESDLAVHEYNRSATQDQRERDALEARIEQLKEEVRIKREDAERYRAELSQNKVEFLRMEQHRSVLEQAVREAQDEVIIISPWMTRRACNDYLCNLFGDAMRRGVRIRIGYGMGQERNQEDADRNWINVRDVRAAIRRAMPPGAERLLEMRETSGTHQKILICDRTFAVTGSFNWLSYAGSQDSGRRNETGTLFRGVEQVNELVQIALESLESKS